MAEIDDVRRELAAEQKVNQQLREENDGLRFCHGATPELAERIAEKVHKAYFVYDDKGEWIDIRELLAFILGILHAGPEKIEGAEGEVTRKTERWILEAVDQSMRLGETRSLEVLLSEAHALYCTPFTSALAKRIADVVEKEYFVRDMYAMPVSTDEILKTILRVHDEVAGEEKKGESDGGNRNNPRQGD